MSRPRTAPSWRNGANSPSSSRLRRDVQLFLADEHRERIQKLDADLQQQPAAKQTKLVSVLERYVLWLDRLLPTDLQKIENIDDVLPRLAMIQDLRDRDWIETQPKAIQKQFAGLKATERQKLAHALRQAEQKRHVEWQQAARFWKRLNDGKQPPPLCFANLTKMDQEGVANYLVMFLSPEEKKRLQVAEGLWPDYVTTLVDLADKHPFALPGHNGPTRVEDLPGWLQKRLEVKEQPATTITLLDKLRKQFPKGTPWPGMGEAVVRYNRLLWKKNDALPRELWACNKESLLPPMQGYVAMLQNSVQDADWAEVTQANNKWPHYPLAIQKVAEKYKLPPPPWHTALSGPRKLWDDFRPVRAEDQPLQVSQQVLQDFMMFKLKPEERAKLNFSPHDPQSWKRVEAKFQEHAQALSKLFPINGKKFGKGYRH